MAIVTLPDRSGAAAPLTQRLTHFLSLSPSEVRLLSELQSAGLFFRRGQDIIAQDRANRTLLIVLEGFAIRYRILRDGGRQVLNVLVPGDIAGAPGCFFESALYSIRALTNMSTAPVPLSRLLSLSSSHPQLATKILWAFLCEGATYTERVIAVGRRTAPERVAHFLLELRARMQAVNLADEESFCLPLTQEIIADALGLSVPYVNHILRQLRDDGFVCIKEKTVVIKDIEALSAMVDFKGTYLKPLSIADVLNDAA